MPFDWIFSSPEMVSHAIRDDFVEFLNPKNIEVIPVERRPHPDLHRADHIFYRDNFGVDFVYNHHDPSLRKSDYDYFVRCVERFRALRKSDNNILFLLFKHISGEPNELSHSAYGRLADLLHPHRLLCMEIVHRPGTSSSYDAIVSDGNLEVGHLNIAEPCTGIAFGSSGDHEAATAIVRARMTGQRPAPIPLRLGGAASNNASPAVCSNSPRHVDQVTLYRGMLTVDGWAKSGPPIVLYDGEPVSAWQSYPVSRPDVAQAYGPAALEWGFSVRAVVAQPPLDSTKIALAFPDGARIASPNIIKVTAQVAHG